MKNIHLNRKSNDLSRNASNEIDINVISIRIIAVSAATAIGAMFIYSQSTISDSCMITYIASKNYENAAKALGIFIYLMLPCLLAWTYRFMAFNLPPALEKFIDFMVIFKVMPVFFRLSLVVKRAISATASTRAARKVCRGLHALNRFSTKTFKYSISNRFRLLSRYIGDLDGPRVAVGLGTVLSYASFAMWVWVMLSILGPGIREFSTPNAVAHARDAAKYCAELSGKPLNFTPIDPFKDNAPPSPYSSHSVVPIR